MFRIGTIFILMFLSFQSFGQLDSLHFYYEVDDVNSPPGQVDVKVNVNDWESLVTVQVFFLFDSTVLKVVEVPFIDNATLPSATVLLPSPFIATSQQGEAKFNFFDFSGPSLPDSSHIFTLRFDIVGQPCDATNITIGDIGTQASQVIEVTGIDANGNLVPGVGATSNDVEFMIPGTNCNAAAPVGFTFPTLSADPGDNLCIPLVVTNFDSIDSFGGSVNWDPAVLQYTGVQGFGVPNFSSTDFNANAGDLSYSWADLNADVPSINDGGTLFEVCFDLVGAAGTSSTVVVSDMPNIISVTKSGPTASDPSVPLMFTIGAGAVSVNAPQAQTPVQFAIPGLSADAGDNICVPLNVNNFVDITDVAGSLNWNASVLQFTGVQGFNLPGFTATDFNLSQSAGGSLGFEWMHPGGMTTTLSNGDNLFEVCFDVIGAAGQSSNISIANAPTTTTVGYEGVAPAPTFTTTGNGGISVNGTTGGGTDVVFTFPDLTGDPGDNVCFPLTVTNFTSITAFNGNIMWDPSVLSYTALGNSGLPGFSPNDINVNSNTGEATFVWTEPSGFNPTTLADGSTAIELCFDVIGTSGSSTPVKLFDQTTPGGTVVGVFSQGANPAMPPTELMYTQIDGSFTVSGTPPPSNGIVFTFPDLSGSNGDNVCFPLTVTNFNNITAFNGNIMWDPSILTYTGLGTTNLPAFGDTDINVTNADGEATFVWTEPSGFNPVTLANNTTAIELCFDVIGSQNDVTTIKLFDQTTPGGTVVGVFSQGANPAVPPTEEDFTLVDGSYTVTSGGGDEVNFILGDVCIPSTASTVCVPMVVENFAMISSLDFNLMWDPAVLSFTGIDNFELTGFVPDNVNANNAASGTIIVQWFDLTTTSPVTVADGTTILDICFNVLGDLGDVSEVSMFSDPNQTEITVSQAGATPAEPTMALPFTLDNGSVSIKDDIVETFIVDVSETEVGTNDNVGCVDMIVDNFTNINSTEWHVTWDPSELCFREVTNLNPAINGLSVNNFGTGFGEGRINISWMDQSGNNLPDGSNYFTVCFDVKIDCGETAEVNITEDPDNFLPFVVTNQNAPTTSIDHDEFGGSISRVCGPIEPLTIDVNQVVTVDAGCNNSGRIFVPFSGGVAPFTCSLSGPGLSPTPSPCTSPISQNGLGAGTYTFTVNDSTGASVSGTYTLSTSAMPTLSASVTDLVCDANGNPITLGSITLSATGGTPPYTYLPGQSQTGLNAGTYRVEVQDAAGCSDVRFVTINECTPVGTPLAHSITTTSAMCNDLGSILVVPSGGVPPYQVFFSPAVSNTNAVPPGVYTVTCRDAAGNEVVATATVGEIAAAPINIFCTNNVSSNCGQGGSIDLEFVGGCAPLSCELRRFENGVLQNPIACFQGTNSLLPGMYELTVRDAIGTIQTKSFTISDNASQPVVTPIATPGGPCASDAGIINVNVSQGCPPYAVTIDGAAVSANQDIVFPPGTYTLVVSDASNNPLTFMVTVDGPTEVFDFSVVTDSCRAEVIDEVGAGPFTYSWTSQSGVDIPSANVSGPILDLMPGMDSIFFISVTDGFNCTVTQEVMIDCIAGGDDPCGPETRSMISFVGATGGMTACADNTNCSGTISATLSQAPCASNPYTITASNSIGESISIILEEPGLFTFSDLCADTYDIVVDDADGNTIVLGFPLEVVAPDPISLTLDTIACSDSDPSGSIGISVSGGVPGYTVLWENAFGEAVPGVFELTDLSEGLYFVSVTDSNDCVLSDAYDIEECVEIGNCDNLEDCPCDNSPVMSANGDGINDVLVIECDDFIGDITLGVYDRWGRLVYNNDAYNNDWNGVGLDGEELGEGAYYWVVQRLNADGTTFIDKGTVTILRNRN